MTARVDDVFYTWQDQFDAQVRKTGDHWLWTGRLDKHGYGLFRGKQAHIVAYRRWVGEIPMDPTRPGNHLVLGHLDEPPCPKNCVRPDHLEPITQQENLRRSPRTFQGKNVRKIDCGRCGLPLAGENLYIRPNGSRACRSCLRAAKARYRESQRVD
jgi:hypothetical protein